MSSSVGRCTVNARRSLRRRKPSNQHSSTPRQGQPQERGRGGKAGWTRGQVAMHREGWRCLIWQEEGSTPKASSSDLRGLQGMPRHPGLPLGSSKPRRSWALGTHLGCLPAEGTHSHITAFLTNRSVLLWGPSQGSRGLQNLPCTLICCQHQCPRTASQETASSLARCHSPVR